MGLGWNCVSGEQIGRRAVAVLVATAALGVGVGAVPAGADPLDDAKARVAAAQQRADEATARYSEAQTREAELTAEIDTLAAEIAAGKERAAELKLKVQRRAVTAYKNVGGANPLAGLGDDEPLAGARREKLLEEASASDNGAVDELARVDDDLEERRDQLEQGRQEAEDALTAMNAEAQQLEADLAVAQAAQAQLEEAIRQLEAARQEAERQKAAREEAERQAQQRAASAPRPDSGASVPATDVTIICPIDGPVSFVDSWHAPRHQGLHMGVDLMAARGTPNVAVVSGDAEMRDGGLPGHGVRLHGDDGNLYYYFHLDSYEGGSRHVSQGEVVGYTGNTGDASGGPTHTHFEIHPGGGAAVNPYPYVAAVC